MAKRSLFRRLLRGIGILIGILIVAILALVVWQWHGLPEGKTGPEAEALAQSMEKAVNLEAWGRTGAVRWSWAGVNEHLWDRARSLARVRHGTWEVLLDLKKKDGRAFENGVEAQGEAKAALVDKAYRAWINDAFWLNPIAKLRDPGVSRLYTTVDGKPALIAQYASGGVTPGDSYLWIPADDGRPRAWRLYVSIIPVKGLESTWEGWTPLSTGALVSTQHRILGALKGPGVGDVAGAATLAELVPGADPFAPLFNR